MPSWHDDGTGWVDGSTIEAKFDALRQEGTMAEREAHVEYYEDRAGEWRWRAWAANGAKVADGAEGYKRRADAVEGSLVALAALENTHAEDATPPSGG
jgi:uncharacterized protein YegP (UPF0339 family)